MDGYRNYRLYGLNGLPTENLEGASTQLVRIPIGGSLSVKIGRLRPKIFGNDIRKIREIRS